MRAAIVVFPGSNCDRDALDACQRQAIQAKKVWHKDTALPDGTDLVVLPGGFSYGDYLRTGAIGAKSPIMREVIDFAKRGGYVLGICNGFQILAETGLLPGALTRNHRQKFICRNVALRVETTSPIFLRRYQAGEVITLPVAHADGRYMADEATLQQLEDEGRVAFRYMFKAGEEGDYQRDDDMNGSAHAIAGVLNVGKNVLGMMPHPERACDAVTGGIDGAPLFQAFA